MPMIRQSTARTILVGPVLDSNGAAKTDEVVASIKITKNGTVAAADAAATLTHNHTGKYLLALTAADTDTLGVLEVSLNSGTNDMPVARVNVVPANVWDSLVLGTDKLQGDAVEWGGAALPTAFAANNLPADYLSTGEQAALVAAATGSWYAAPSIPTPPTAQAISTQVWADKPTIGTSTLTAGDIDARLTAFPVQKSGEAVTLPATAPSGYGGDNLTVTGDTIVVGE